MGWIRFIAPAWLRRLIGAGSGNVAVIFALAAPVVVGCAGLSAETAYWYYAKTQLQAAADSAAYAAAIDDRAGLGYSAIVASATAAARQNGYASGLGSITVNAPPTSGPNKGGAAVEVILTQTRPRFFSQVFNTDAVSQSARAVAVFTTASKACVLALDKTASKAALVSGSAAVTLTGCEVMANSIAADAITVSGSSQLTTDCAVSVGGVSNSGGLSLTQCASAVTQAPPVADPYVAVAAPSISGSCLSGSGSTLFPGYYCNGMSLKGNVTLSPGVYYVSGGDFATNANAVISGTGVTIYLAGGAKVSMHGAATLTLSAPSSGTYSGILFFGDRNSSGVTNIFNGTSSSSLTGDLYFATQQVTYNGNFSGTNGCTHVIADTIQWNGHATVNVNCSSYGMRTIPARQTVAIEE